MGVPRLSTRLRAISSNVTLTPPIGQLDYCESRDAPSNAGSNRLIIDGPSFAYHVYNLCVGACLDKPGALDKFPTYNEVASAAISLLDALETFGLTVDSIFFDGHLPQVKYETRWERERQSYLGVSEFRSRHSEFLTPTPTASGIPPSNTFLNSLMNARRGTRVLAKRPCQPFLVPCIIETLQDHPKYRATIRIVPGEADVFCKLRSEQVKLGMILTNDSDLVLLDPPCPVAFIDTLDIHLGEASKLQVRTCLSSEIRKRLGDQDLVKIGYQLLLHPEFSLEQCAARVKAGNLDESSASYLQFRQTYFPDANVQIGQLPTQSKIKVALQHLDPRVSELVIDTVFPVNSSGKARMFLTPLIEDTTRASAWRASSPVRLLAYKILSMCTSTEIEIIEVFRRGQRPVEQSIQLLSAFETQEALENVSRQFKKLPPPNMSSKAQLDSNHRTSAWVWLALTQVRECLLSAASKLPTRKDMEDLLLGPSRSRKLSWSSLYLQAQVEAMLYSYRILKQIIEMYDSVKDSLCDEDSMHNQSIPVPRLLLDDKPLAHVERQLDGLPPIQELHKFPLQAIDNGALLAEIMDTLDEIYGAQQSPEQEDATGEGWRSGQKGKKAGKRSRPLETKPKESEVIKLDVASNPYALLELED